MKINQPAWSVTRERSKHNSSPVRSPVFDAFNFLEVEVHKTAITFVLINIDLSQTWKVLACQPWYVFVTWICLNVN